ncbi:endolytic transglycosylase MltG [Halocola ammonii]
MKALKILFVILIIAAAIAGGYAYKSIYMSNTSFEENEKVVLIYTGQSYGEVVASLEEKVLKDVSSFDWVADLKSYPELVKPGRYSIPKGSSNNDIVNKLRLGEQDPVMVTFNNVRTEEELAGKIADDLEADSLIFLEVLKDRKLMRELGFEKETYPAMFIPNSYEMYWTTKPESFVERMKKEYDRFWNDERRRKADAIKFTPEEVVTLASIVQAETSQKDEAPKIAGVYLNRIRKGIPLQADPTLIFALGDFSIKRVLNKHKEIDSPYNTYKFAGLPPGPINYPMPNYVDAVLNAENHDYYYFCAKPDFSGYHNFSKSYSQHLIYAREYQRELNKRRIYQ